MNAFRESLQLRMRFTSIIIVLHILYIFELGYCSDSVALASLVFESWARLCRENIWLAVFSRVACEVAVVGEECSLIIFGRNFEKDDSGYWRGSHGQRWYATVCKVRELLMMRQSFV